MNLRQIQESRLHLAIAMVAHREAMEANKALAQYVRVHEYDGPLLPSMFRHISMREAAELMLHDEPLYVVDGQVTTEWDDGAELVTWEGLEDMWKLLGLERIHSL